MQIAFIVCPASTSKWIEISYGLVSSKSSSYSCQIFGGIQKLSTQIKRKCWHICHYAVWASLYKSYLCYLDLNNLQSLSEFCEFFDAQWDHVQFICEALMKLVGWLQMGNWTWISIFRIHKAFNFYIDLLFAHIRHTLSARSIWHLAWNLDAHTHIRIEAEQLCRWDTPKQKQIEYALQFTLYNSLISLV